MVKAERGPELPPREKARIEHRDRKRETRMVVDNAAVKRVLPAVRGRRTKQPPDPAQRTEG